MRFTPKSDEELQRDRLIADGIYDFDVLDATDGVTRSGKEMVALKLRVYMPNGGAVELRDWLVSDEQMMWKIKKFCETIGLLEAYEAGEVTSDDLPGRSGKCKVGRKDDPEYGPQNRIVGYGEPVKRDKKQPHESAAMGGGRKMPQPPPDELTEDDIPF